MHYAAALPRCVWGASLDEDGILIDGPDAAKAQRDPFGDGPPEYEPFDGGFVLRSKLKMQDKQESLTVGRRK